MPSFFRKQKFNKKPTIIRKSIIEREKADGTKEYSASVVMDMGTLFFGLFRNRTTYYLHSNWGHYHLSEWDECVAWVSSKHMAIRELESGIEQKIKSLLNEKIVSVKKYEVLT